MSLGSRGYASDPVPLDTHVPSMEHDRLLAGQRAGEVPSSNASSCCTMLRKLPLLVIATCVCNAVPDGLVYCTSYLISPVSRTCSPPWSASATIYGSSAVSAGWVVGGFLGFLLSRKRLKLYFLLTVITGTLAVGSAGAMVMSCDQMTQFGEILYIAMFAVYGTSTSLLYIAISELAISSIPNWPGFASGIYGVSVGVGTLLIPQIIIGLRQWLRSLDINEGTIFFCLAIFKLTLSAPWFPVVSAPCEGSDTNQSHGRSPGSDPSRNVLHILKSYKMWLVSIGCFTAYVPVMATFAVQEPILYTLWNDSHAPISTLSAILMACFLAGRIGCLLLSDKIGVRRVWILALLVQMACLLCLGFLMFRHKYGNSLKHLGFGALCLYYCVIPVFKSTLAGLCHDVLGSKLRLAAVSAQTTVSGAAGIIGPVAIDAIHSHFNDYYLFFFGSACMSLIGAIAVMAVQSRGISHEEDSSTRTGNQQTV